jgi:hypothetical protein
MGTQLLLLLGYLARGRQAAARGNAALAGTCRVPWQRLRVPHVCQRVCRWLGCARGAVVLPLTAEDGARRSRGGCAGRARFNTEQNS